ncbi:3-phosphoshikimate 1-carboxyvinyltransferase [hydrothermal vent metagenome]|uniref:3-phosphoshikimate 1-carboxyvinyltransferase n=1 Tax=hydrothermal vent metagenome TaxID=652676 RepID=A0A3B1BNR5_9ZZZZ
MKFIIEPSGISGLASVPPSKSHTIRAVFFAALGEGESVIKNPLESSDGDSALAAVMTMGANAKISKGEWLIEGVGGEIIAPLVPVDVGNSGTTARFAISMASLNEEPVTITGDDQTKGRPMGPLLEALSPLGVSSSSAGGKLPVTIRGPIRGGATTVDGMTSQYLSSLLIHTPLAPEDTVITLGALNEKPYVDLTLSWLDKLGIEYKREGYEIFEIRGGQSYRAFEETIPGDFSSATFFACMGAMPGCSITLTGLDMNDPQGDKETLAYIARMGASVDIDNDNNIVKVTGNKLGGARLDLNATPDALPAMAALAALADGVTWLGNVPQARIKETDRIAVMAEELGKMGILCEEKPDALIVHGGAPAGAKVSSHGDHRVAMALALLASQAKGTTVIDKAEAVNITFPTFAEIFSDVGGVIEAKE